MSHSSSSLLTNLCPVPLLSRMCIGLAPILPSLLPFVSLLSCITFWCYTSWHRPQPWDTPQLQSFLCYFSSHMMLACPNKSSTTHLAPRHYLYYPLSLFCSLSQWLGIETLRTKLAISHLLSQNVAWGFCFLLCVFCVCCMHRSGLP